MINPDAAPRTRKKAFAVYIFAYILALMAAIAVGYASRKLHPVLIILTADVAGTMIIYGFGRVFRNASFYDAYWSAAPPAIALFWILRVPADGAVTARQIIVILLVFAWAVRLTYNWAHQWRGLKDEDWRYQDLRKKSGGWFWLVDLVGIEMMPTAIVFLACLSLYPALAAGMDPFGVLDIVAIVVTAGAIVIEAVADAQLRTFIRRSPQRGEIMAKGLWAYSRHPNYLGEIVFWWGLFIFALAAYSGYWWTVAGPAAVTVLFTFISIPLMEKRNMARRPGYAEHRKKIPALLPWFPGK